MRKILIGAAMSVSMALAGSAGAATLNDQLELVLDVESVCHFELNDKVLQSRVFNSEAGSIITSSPEGYIYVECNQGASYTIEAGVGAGGFIELTGDATGDKVPAYLLTDNRFDGGVPWSTLSNSEAMSGVATGGLDQHKFVFVPNVDSSGRALNLPKADAYRANVEITFNY
ncbi:TPA: hypothetical protein ACG4NQ_000508 [Stenotrophomonas maltophilia]